MTYNPRKIISVLIAVCLMFTLVIPSYAQISDISNHWARSAFEKWTAEGLLKGYADGSYKPNNIVTKAEFLAFIDRIFKYTDTTDKKTKDVVSDAWYETYISKALAAGIIQEDENGNIEPQKAITRGAAAVIIANAFDLKPVNLDCIKTYTDYGSIPYGSCDAIAAMTEKGYINGNTDGTFGYNRLVTRAEAVTMISRAMGTVVKASGTYTSSVTGNLIVNAKDVLLKDITISGDLYLTQGIGQGDVTLQNVKVTGKTYVFGGGVNSIKIKDSVLSGTLILLKKDGKLRVVAQGTTNILETQLYSGAVLEEENLTGTGFANVIIMQINPASNVIRMSGDFNNIDVKDKGADVQLITGSANALTILDSASEAKILVDAGFILTSVIANAGAKVSGKGKITNATVNSSGVEFEQTPSNLKLTGGITVIIGGSVKNTSYGNVGSTDSTLPTTTPPAEDPLKDKMEISLAMWGVGYAFDNSNPDAVREQIYKDLNITIHPMNVYWADYKEQIQVWAVTGQLPDMFAIDLLGTANYKKWIDQGLLKPLPADLSPYPQLDKLLNSDGSDIYKYPISDANGKIYALPRLNHTNIDDWSTDCGVMVRKDWMANVGVTKEPETMDEFISLMTKFVNNDPNGNGIKDEIGLTMYSADWLSWFQLAYEPGIQSGGWVKDPNNAAKWIPAFMTPKALEGIKALKKLYDAGGMDKDFASLKGEVGRDKFAASIAGAYAHDLTPSTLAYVEAQFVRMPQNEGINFADAITVLKPFKNADGNYYRHIATPAWSETYINANVSDKKEDRILRFMNYCMEEKGYNLLHFGIEGTDYHKVGGKIVLDPTTDAGGNIIDIAYKYPVCSNSFIMEWSGTRQWSNPSATPVLQKISSDLNDWLQANAKAVPTDLRINCLYVPSKEKATADYADDLIKCILSDNVDKTWNDLVAGYKANGYDTYVSEINAKCTELGIKP